MIFDIPHKEIFKFKKLNFIETKEIQVLLNDDCPIFAIVHLNKNLDNQAFETWALVHRPSERTLLSCFYEKEEIEYYVDILAEYIDLNNIFFYNPNFPDIKKEIELDIEIAYKKYQSKRKNE